MDFFCTKKLKGLIARSRYAFLTATEYFHEKIRREQGLGDYKQKTFLRKPIENEDLVREIDKLLQSE